jgi:hypothetical protein
LAFVVLGVVVQSILVSGKVAPPADAQPKKAEE